MKPDEQDYSSSGLDIQYAILDQIRTSKGGRKGVIRWGDRLIQTADTLKVPRQGIVKTTIIQSAIGIKQGFDIKVNGGVLLRGGESVPLLRTWHNSLLENTVEYKYRSNDGALRTWNVYTRHSETSRPVEEKWTGNAGFWVESVSDLERVYHCSNGLSVHPDFESFIYSLKILET